MPKINIFIHFHQRSHQKCFFIKIVVFTSVLTQFNLSTWFCQFWRQQTSIFQKIHSILHMLFLNKPKNMIKEMQVYGRKDIQSP